METDTKRGIYEKYKVKRTDGSSGRGGKHEDCPYFVLDLEHDRHAKAAIKAYAKSCKKQYPQLAKDLLNLLEIEPGCGCRSATLGRFFGVPRKPSFGDGY